VLLNIEVSMKSDIYILYNIFSKYQSHETEYDKKVIYENIKQNIVKLHWENCYH